MTERKGDVIIKICYYDQLRHRVVWNNKIERQESDDNCELGGNYVAGQVYLARIYYVW